MAKIIQIDLNRIDPQRIDTRLRRNGEEARFYSVVLVDDDIPDKFNNTGEIYEKLTKAEYDKGFRGRLIGYAQQLQQELKRKQDDSSGIPGTYGNEEA
jgi:hypothetical protein